MTYKIDSVTFLDTDSSGRRIPGNVVATLKQRDRAKGKTSNVLYGGKRSARARHLTNPKEIVNEIDNARRIFEAMKIEAKDSDEEIGEWNDTIDVKIEEANSGIENLEEWLAQREMEAETREREDCWANIPNN
ncbi:hypothetical protein pdam_00003090 [Pocillopora damicornis]|uniref:Uncharacterized protein n=1 Tax=Pocillopora damicornis TaxID=46731 RepID=A0A3M6T9P1_POCDA|nr:hypothetical protein pdam_00003090 [Pocillopora damicornis]